MIWKVHFQIRAVAFLRKNRPLLRASYGVSFRIKDPETIGIVVNPDQEKSLSCTCCLN